MDQVLFILGLPRSGTTLLQRILSSSDEIGTAPEPWLLLPFLSYREPRHYKAIYSSREAILAINEFLGEDPTFDRGLADYIRRYLQGRYKNFRYFCEKTPRNLLYVDRLRNWFPDDRYIILNRNPLNVAVSIFNTFESGVLNPYKFQVDLDLGLRNLIAQNRNPKGALVIRYEDLVDDPTAILARCSQFLGLDKIPTDGDIPPLVGSMGDPTGQVGKSRIEKQSEMGYLQFIDSVYRKRWFIRFMKEIGPEGFDAIGYDFQRHLQAIKEKSATKLISVRDCGYLIGRKLLEFATFRLLSRRPAERPNYPLF